MRKPIGRIREVLENDIGLNILLMNRLQLLCNYARMQLRQNDWRKAFEVGCLLLAYIEAPEENSSIAGLEEPWGQGWNSGLKSLPRAPMAGLHWDTAGIVIRALDCAETEGSREEALSHAFRLINGASVETQVSLWLAVELLRTTGSMDYGPKIIALLRRGRMPSEPLWLLSVNHANELGLETK